MSTITKTEFKDWYEDFVNKNKGIAVPPEDFYDLVAKSHEKLREKIGDVRKVFPIELETIQLPVDYNLVEPLIEELYNKIRGYFTTYGINKDAMCTPCLPFGDLKGTKWGKHIQHWMRVNKLDKAIVSDVNNIVSKLGSQWSKCKTHKQMLYASISTDPRSFVQIGHYGPDNRSCFRQGVSNERHKYKLALHENTYVVFVTKDGELEKESSDHNSSVLCRMWGVATPDYEKFCAGNYYIMPNTIEGNVVKSYDKMFAQLLGADKAKKHENVFGVGGSIYQNSGHNWTYTKPDVSIIKDKIIVTIPEPEIFTKICVCAKCQIHFFKNEDTFYYNDRVYCENCSNKFERCFFTKQKCPSLYNVINSDGSIVLAAGDYITNNRSLIVQCDYSGVYCCTDATARTSDGYKVCKYRAIDYNFVKCDSCDVYIKRSSHSKCISCGSKE